MLNGETLAVILVLNRLSGEIHRTSIRSTYGNFSSFKEKVNFKWKILFLTGKPGSDKDREKIFEESRIYGDILVTNVEDQYYSPTTLKLLIGFEFISNWFRNCKDIRFLVKTDDDVYLRLPKLERIINGVAIFSLNHHKIIFITWSYELIRNIHGSQVNCAGRGGG